MRKSILAPILWIQIQLTDLVYPNRVHNIAPQVSRSREGVQGMPWAPRNGLQASGFADEYLKWPGATPILKIYIIEVMYFVEKIFNMLIVMHVFWDIQENTTYPFED